MMLSTLSSPNLEPECTREELPNSISSPPWVPLKREAPEPTDSSSFQSSFVLEKKMPPTASPEATIRKLAD